MAPSHRRVAIIGAGFSGLCAAIRLKQSGRHDFVILERASALGGTWRDNAYPGAECDVEIELYTYSFEPFDKWTHTYARQPDILAYIEHCVDKYGLASHIRYNQEVLSVRYSDAASTYTLTTSSNESMEFDIVISCVGLLHRAFTPAIDGATTFTGTSFHSAEWNASMELDNKRVACIGSAASAIQLIPEIAPKVSQLYVFQRSANWVLPKLVRSFNCFERWLFRNTSWYHGLRRWLWRFIRETLVFSVLYETSQVRRPLEGVAKWWMGHHVKDESMRKHLTPSYPLGAKRILISDTYYSALVRENTSLVTASIEAIEPSGVRTTDGIFHPVDVIIYATGFKITSFLAPMDVFGVNGMSLQEFWQKNQAQAYLGMTHAGFPNFFMMYGPNTSTGHTSIILMCEAQTSYIVSCLDLLDAKEATTLQVKDAVQEQFNHEVQQQLKLMAWCGVKDSPYNDRNGNHTVMWPWKIAAYEARTRTVNEADYILS